MSAGVRAGRPQALRGGQGAGRGRDERGGPEEAQQEQEAGEEAGYAPQMFLIGIEMLQNVEL